MATIRNDEEGTRTIVLSENYGKFDEANETLAKLREGACYLVRLQSPGKTKKFQLSYQEMENLVAAWAQFKADREAERLAEKQRQLDLVEEARDLAAAIDGEVTPEDSEELYRLRLSGRWSHCSMQYAYPGQILRRLQEIHADLERERKSADPFPDASYILGQEDVEHKRHGFGGE